MIEYFSKNANIELGGIGAESIVPFASQRLLKGCTVSMSGNSIQINKCGVYDVDCDVCFEASAACDVTFVLYVDGVAQPQTETTVTVSGADVFNTAHISTYITKQDNNCRCNPCTAPTNVYLAVSSSVADTEVAFQTTDIKAYKVV
ncbi:MAG: hypothetical protein IKN54_06145 [Lachnospiraceae bacterium]|nr:hypothetical protein [Lachnospiraceae bacterium]